VPAAPDARQVNVANATDGGRRGVQSGPAYTHKKIDGSLKLGRLPKNVAQEVSHGPLRCLLIGTTSPLA
jgi:hypothetical protein